MRVPFIDLTREYKYLKDDIDNSVRDIFTNGRYVLGSKVDEFEGEFSRYCGTNYCIAVGSGTSAIQISLLSIGIKPGDEVITVPNTYVGTVEAIIHAGAHPVLVDIDESYCMDVSLLEAAITKRTGAIVPVHMYGMIANMSEILSIANKYHIPVVEDACQAHGSVGNGKRAGSVGVCGCFSFYPTKNLGSCGHCGAIVTSNPDVASNARLLRYHGMVGKRSSSVIGYNSIMSEIEAAVLSIKLSHLDEWNSRRVSLAYLYHELVSDHVVTPIMSTNGDHIYHLYVIRTDKRDVIKSYLEEHGVCCGIHYPVPIHLQEAYRYIGYDHGKFPVAENISSHILSLPLYNFITEEEVSYVSQILKEGVKIC